MAIQILIDVKNLIKQDEEQNIIHYQTRGLLYQKGQATYLQYEEGTEGLEGVQTTLKLEKDRVTLIRHGDMGLRQVFEEGKKDSCEYHTAFGSLSMMTETQGLEHALGMDEGRIRITYNVYFAGDLSSNNTLEVVYESIVD